MFVSPSQAARMLDDFMIGAVMQQDPFLEEFGNLPDEPPDEDSAWNVPDTDESGGDGLEQGMLFDLPRQEQRMAKPHPPKSVRQSATPTAKRAEEMPPPYVPRHFEFAEYLSWFNGDCALAAYWHGKQNM